MKKELLIASALVGSLGVVGAANAADYTLSGHHRVGVMGADTNSTDASNDDSRQSTFSVALSQMTDGGTTISTGFDLSEEALGLDPSGLTFAFNSGYTLDLIEAGAAGNTHLASIPSGGGEMAVTAGTVSNAPTTLTFASSTDDVGFEFHTAGDAFGVKGLKAGISASFNGDVATTTTSHATEASYSVGASYVTTTAGDDTTITVGGGWYQAESNNTVANYEEQAFAISGSAVTGNLTIGVGFADGTDMGLATSAAKVDGDSDSYAIADASVLKAGVSYVSGKMTMNLGMTSGEGNDTADVAAVQSGANDSYENVNASVTYAVADGVTATVGYADISRSDDGQAVTANSGNSWYIGAQLSF
jgi:alpha-D-ribose 1-methylphosphonate 5-triphosphate synthase subunit PhnG